MVSSLAGVRPHPNPLPEGEGMDSLDSGIDSLLWRLAGEFLAEAADDDLDFIFGEVEGVYGELVGAA